MERIYINELKSHLNQPVYVQGFVENLRDSKTMAFIVLKDITNKVQITIDKESQKELFKIFRGINAKKAFPPAGKKLEYIRSDKNGKPA